MFSEYASKFLSQSQSRLSSFAGQDNNDRPLSRQQGGWTGRGRGLSGRSYYRGAANPYQPTGSRFGTLAGFGSRYAQDAPLFQATVEQEEEEEDDREAADLFALQRSRRVIPAARLEDSTEAEDDGSASLERSRGYEDALGTRLHGIRSSWNDSSTLSKRENDRRQGGSKLFGKHKRQGSDEDDSTKGAMEDVGLQSTIAEDDDDPPEDLLGEASVGSSPPAFQQFKSQPAPQRYSTRRSSVQDSEAGLLHESRRSFDGEMPPDAGLTPAHPVSDGEIFVHDPFFAYIFLIALASLFATFVLVYLHTSGKRPLGDTIYNTITRSFNLLAVDTLVSMIVAFVWLATLRTYIRPLVYLILVSVPIIMTAFSLYPLILSFRSTSGSTRAQDTVMRWASTVPATAAVVWIYMVFKGRVAIRSAINILEFSSRILAANSPLMLVGVGCLAAVVLWTWVWLLMFTRVFLGGSFSSYLSRFIISASSWWLGIYFVLMYIWTLSILSGIQRATTAATVSQWYFHRNAVPAASSKDVVSAALGHAISTIFGTISMSTLIALAIRLPLLILPARVANILSMFVYSFVPTPIATLTNPLTLTYAAIHSESLAVASRGLSRMDFLSPQRPTTTLTPVALRNVTQQSSPLLPYRLAKLILHATRFIMATALGFAGWVMTARQLTVERPDGSMGLKGSAYAYVVGMVASFIGWGILGAMEGILSGIVDAVVICYGSERGMASGGYCMEAAQLFGSFNGSYARGRGDEEDRHEVY
ncbi:hypothetical protein B0T20DRAFT_480753 [Sordaria brevicollis]|uniref:Protein PNS1 n=1 Tax=Sordaria brevicollis TaxID=83679 RepID=A0AAE0UAP2_SORBR|nr:hypothetical protein B0T20DRAFT_480753 [Sordaria brevicollis]